MMPEELRERPGAQYAFQLLLVNILEKKNYTLCNLPNDNIVRGILNHK